MKIILSILTGLALLVFFVEKMGRYTYRNEVWQPAHVDVKYEWENRDASWMVDDPVNLGINRHDWSINIPSYGVHTNGYPIDRDFIVAVTPIKNATYTCTNEFWTITCEGMFAYRLDSQKTPFMRAGFYESNPPESWLTAVRRATLTVYKYQL